MPRKPRKGFRYSNEHGWYWYEDEHSLDKCIAFWARDHTPIAFTRPGPAAPPAQAQPQRPPAKRRRARERG
jgi:hypothetical protein